MTMSCQYLDKDKVVEYSLNNTACFAGVEGYYNKNKHKYFALLFPKQKTKEKQDLTHQYIESLKEIWNFGEYMQDIDYENHKIIFDLDVIPGHIIFAISTCVRYMEEYPSRVFSIWKSLNNPEYFNLTSFEKFLFMHYLYRGGNSNHAIFNTTKQEVDKFLTHKPIPMGGGIYGEERRQPPKGYDLPFREFQHFRNKISLFQTYSPEGLSNCNYQEKEDGSFKKYLEAHCLNLNVLERKVQWSNDVD